MGSDTPTPCDRCGDPAAEVDSEGRAWCGCGRAFPPVSSLLLERAARLWPEDTAARVDDELRRRTGQGLPSSLGDVNAAAWLVLADVGEALAVDPTALFWLPVALLGVHPANLLPLLLEQLAADQWTDGELEAAAERLAAFGGRAGLVGEHHDRLSRARLLARGRARSAMWALTRAVRVVMTRDGDTFEVSDNATRFRACRELLRQHGGWTSQGFAADVQREIELLERTGQSPELSH